MRNERSNDPLQDLIKTSRVNEKDQADILNKSPEKAHVKMADFKPNENATDSRKGHQNFDTHAKLEMARKPIEHMAFKADVFPCPQLIVFRADSNTLNDFLKIRLLTIGQGHYITSITDRSGKATQEVLQIMEKNRPINIYNRAQRQVDEERSGTQNPNSSATPPRKTLRLTESIKDQPRMNEDNAEYEMTK